MWFMALIALSVMVTGDYRKKMPKMGDNHYLCAAFCNGLCDSALVATTLIDPFKETTP
jgi:hypothetical protein